MSLLPAAKNWPSTRQIFLKVLQAIERRRSCVFWALSYLGVWEIYIYQRYRELICKALGKSQFDSAFKRMGGLAHIGGLAQSCRAQSDRASLPAAVAAAARPARLPRAHAHAIIQRHSL